MRKLFLLTIIFVLAACSNRAGGPVDDSVVIPEADYNFGVIPDTVTDLFHRFYIVNHSDKAVEILRLDKSCGCTTIALADSTISPGDSVALDVRVTVARSFGFFERDISVLTSASKQPLIIYLRASRERPVRQLVQEFPLEVAPGLRASVPFLVMGFVPHGDAKAAYLNVLNTTDKPISYTADIPDAPDYISIYPDEEPIGPGDTGRIAIMADLTDINNVWGIQRYNIRIRACGKSAEVPMEAIFTDNFSALLPDKPVIMMPVTAFTVDPKERSEVKFEIHNLGGSPLAIRDLQIMPAGAAIASMSATTIAAGTKSTLTVTLPSSAKGKIEIGISTNCPGEPYKLATIFTPE